MNKIKPRLIALTLSLSFISAVLSSSLLAQAGNDFAGENYLHLTYRSVTPGREQEFLSNISSIIKPLYEAEINEGRLQGWYLWRPRYKSEHAQYDYVIVRLSNNLADLEEAFEGGLEAASNRVFTNRSWDDIYQDLQIGEISTIVKNELAQSSNLSVLQGAIPGPWANLIYYRNHDRSDAVRDLLLREFLNPLHRQLVERGITNGWAYYFQRLPVHDDESYNVVEVVYYDDFDQILGSGMVPMIWDELKTDNSSSGENIRRLNETRDFVKRETWQLVDYAIAN